MRLRNPGALGARLVQAAVAAALLLTGWPLLRAWLPSSGAPAASPLAERVPGEIVVDLKDRATPAQIEALNTRYGLRLRYNSVHAAEEKLLIGEVPPERADSILARLRKDPLVEAAAPMLRVTAPELPALPAGPPRRPPPPAAREGWRPDDPLFSEQWNMTLVGAEEAWGKKATGKGVVVAVIDTGVAFELDDHGCYQAKDFTGTAFARGYDFVHDDDHPNDDHGHGTHVAGTIAETTNNGEGAAGLAFEATIMPLKVLDEWGSGRSSDIADAVRFAADHGASVINMSLGSRFPDPIMRSACRYARKKGVLIVCAAGNSRGGPVGYPAAFPECLAVSAVGPGGDLAFYSSVGKQVALAAPGGDMGESHEREQDGILQNTVLYETGERQDGYFRFQGTSMASPHVAAAAALVMARGVKDPAQVRQVLERAATPKAPKEHYGSGILSAARSVELADAGRGGTGLLALLALGAGAAATALGAFRAAAVGVRFFPVLPGALLLGLAGPWLLAVWLGFSSPWNLLLHSALLPLYLLWEADSRKVYRFAGALALGFALYLLWSAFQPTAPLGAVTAGEASRWLWTNAAIALGAAVIAWRRSLRRD